jgi:hypothetical protein
MWERGAREKPERASRPSSAFAGSIPSRPPSICCSALTVPTGPNLSALQRRAIPPEPGPPPTPPPTSAPAILLEIYEVCQSLRVCLFRTSRNPASRRTTMQKVANRSGMGWARGDRKWPLNEGPIPNSRAARVHVSTG